MIWKRRVSWHHGRAKGHEDNMMPRASASDSYSDPIRLRLSTRRTSVGSTSALCMYVYMYVDCPCAVSTVVCDEDS